MPPPETATKKRKACLTCTQAKAKCAPSESGPKCYRCDRLNKQCVFPEPSVKKLKQKPRSRVKHLEQRVESLIDLITQKNSIAQTEGNAQPDMVAHLQASPVGSNQSDESTGANTPRTTAPASCIDLPTFETYDPITSGLIEEAHAYRLLEEFKTSFVTTFPFVVIDQEPSTLRQKQPFLFHAILAVTTYKTTQIHHLLADELKRQIARAIEYSRKSLDILQGLLVYAAWYHSFYNPESQQLGIIIQLCVALVQEPGFFKIHKAGVLSASKSVTDSTPSTYLLVRKRAFLGTYFLTVIYAQAWRKRATLQYTRYLAQCCESFASSLVATDALIAPMIKTCELISRVNDHFSYDDVENAEFRGELMLEMSTERFRNELAHLRESAFKLPSVKQIPSLTMMFHLLDIWIHECGVHSLLWQSSNQLNAFPPSLARIKTLYRSLKAATSYLKTFLPLARTQLYQLSLSAWAGWLYSVVVTCKIIFLEENERLGHTGFIEMPGEVDNLLPAEVTDENSRHKHREHQKTIDTSHWNPVVVAREHDFRGLLGQFVDLLSFTLPSNANPWTLPRSERDSMYAIACVVRVVLHGFEKRIRRFESLANLDGSASVQDSDPSEFNATNSFSAEFRPATSAQASSSTPAVVQSTLPFTNFMNFDSLNFDGVSLPSSFPAQQTNIDDWIWDSIMDDFTIPSL